MANLLKRNSLGIGFVALLFVGFLTFYVQEIHAAPAAVYSEPSASATTSVSYLVPASATASTTFQFDNASTLSSKIPSMQSVSIASLYFQFAASSTSSTLVVVPQWSNNNVDWYGFNQMVGTQSASGISDLASTTLAYYFTASNTATSSQVINLPQVSTLHERVQFGVLGGNGAVYNEVDLTSSTQ